MRIGYWAGLPRDDRRLGWPAWRPAGFLLPAVALEDSASDNVDALRGALLCERWSSRTLSDVPSLCMLCLLKVAGGSGLHGERACPNR